ncbi:MAG: DUF2155 domain-containing protein [Rhodospirillales bacterium]|nr:DUF2155 domain-containing protein [Rhodospirillales bacterium]
MRLLLLASAATLIGGAAFAQSLLGQSQSDQNTVVVPPPPPVVSSLPNAPEVPVAPQPAPPPGLVQTPLPPPGSEAGVPPAATSADNGDNGNAPSVQAVSPSTGPLPPAGNTPEATAAAAPPDVAPVPANVWVPGKTAELGVLNKIDGSTSKLTIPVGGQATAGDLTVSVQACVMRPPGALPDSAAFITLQPDASQGSTPVYRGWMVHSAPGATDAGDAGEAFRVITCS